MKTVSRKKQPIRTRKPTAKAAASIIEDLPKTIRTPSLSTRRPAKTALRANLYSKKPIPRVDL